MGDVCLSPEIEMKSTLRGTCKCSKRREVNPARCGTDVKCCCCNLVMRRLSDLNRQRAIQFDDEGANATSGFESSAFSRQCAACDLRAGVTIYCAVQCECSVTKGFGNIGDLMLIWFNLTGGLRGSRNHSNTDVHGRKTAVAIPIAIRGDCMTTFGKKR